MGSSINDIPILLTSSVVAHDGGVALKSTDDRIRFSIQSIEEWLKIDKNLLIVLCDGSSFDFTDLASRYFPDARIECLFFENNQELVKKYGRGYGEGEIVRHALTHSKFINDSGCFAKCSSKLWVDNFYECTKDWNGKLLCKGVFLNVFSIFRKTIFTYIDTRFYVASCAFYKSYLVNAHLQINKKSGHGLEECFRDILMSQGIRKVFFNVAPVISGVGGGIGIHYKNTLKRRLKEDLRLKLLKRNRSINDLFV